MQGMKVLFICSQNRLRSPTAEAVFSSWPGVETRSAGTNHDAETPVSADLIEWADIVLVMENLHKANLKQRFPEPLEGKKLVVLGIPDFYQYMDPELVRLLKLRVPQHMKP
jgi:predicted protein tyrosine phosphatase